MSAERTFKLLILDDEPRILSALRRGLRREPYEIYATESVAEALRILDAEPLELVLSDLKMPGTTGLQFLEQVRARRPQALRMLITGWTEMIPDDAIQALGICAVITKPWEDQALKETLRMACKELVAKTN